MDDFGSSIERVQIPIKYKINDNRFFAVQGYQGSVGYTGLGNNSNFSRDIVSAPTAKNIVKTLSTQINVSSFVPQTTQNMDSKDNSYHMNTFISTKQ